MTESLKTAALAGVARGAGDLRGGDAARSARARRS